MSEFLTEETANQLASIVGGEAEHTGGNIKPIGATMTLEQAVKLADVYESMGYIASINEAHGVHWVYVENQTTGLITTFGIDSVKQDQPNSPVNARTIIHL